MLSYEYVVQFPRIDPRFFLDQGLSVLYALKFAVCNSRYNDNARV